MGAVYASAAVILGAILTAIILVAVIIGIGVARAWVKVARADEALVISGRTQKNPDGQASPVTVIVNGKAVVNPVTQRHEIISLRSRQVVMQASAQSADNVTVRVEAVALVKVGSTTDLVRRAAERFASQDKAIEAFTQDQLEGALRGVIARQTVIELMRDRKSLSDDISTSITPELADQGLVLDSFQIRGITDKVGYIDSLGEPEIQVKRQAAEIAQTNADRAISKQRIANEEQNLIEQTALETHQADATAEVGKAKAAAEQAEELSRAQARQEVLLQQAENRQAELDAQVRRQADADRYQREQAAEAEAFERTKAAAADAEVAAAQAKAVRVKAEADAEATRLAGEAKAAAIRAEAQALKENQEAFLAQRLVDQLPDLMAQFAAGYSRIGDISIVGGTGSPTEQIGGEAATSMRAVLETVRAATGIDLAEVIQGRAVGQAVGQASREQ